MLCYEGRIEPGDSMMGCLYVGTYMLWRRKATAKGEHDELNLHVHAKEVAGRLGESKMKWLCLQLHSKKT